MMEVPPSERYERPQSTEESHLLFPPLILSSFLPLNHLNVTIVLHPHPQCGSFVVMAVDVAGVRNAFLVRQLSSQYQPKSADDWWWLNKST